MVDHAPYNMATAKLLKPQGTTSMVFTEAMQVQDGKLKTNIESQDSPVVKPKRQDFHGVMEVGRCQLS